MIYDRHNEVIARKVKKNGGSKKWLKKKKKIKVARDRALN